MPNSSNSSTTEGNTNPQSPPKKQISAAKRWGFTYNNYRKEDIESILVPKFQSNCTLYVFQEETGEAGTPHLQGYIEFETKRRPTELKLPKQMHWYCAKGTQEENIAYCTKEETRTGSIYTNIKPKRTLKLIDKLFPWQERVRTLCEEEPDDRTVNWVYDENGKNGKTQFAKYMVVKHGAIIASAGGAKDIANLIKNAADSGKDLNEITAFIFNFAREVTSDDVSYRMLEMVKDGLVTNIKYEAETLVFNSPHIWVLANCLPNLSSLTKDRWKVWSINTQKELVELPRDYLYPYGE